MDALISAIFDTEWGIIIFGLFLIIAILIEFYSNNRPQP